MGADGSASGWLLLLAQLPSKPSSTRVALWRRLRAIGATAMVNGAWVLPDTAAHQAFFAELRESIRGPGGTGFVLTVADSSPEVHEAIVGRFRSDRGREYDEFDERGRAFLDEIGKETGAGKYTFAELEEGEQDLDKLARWLTKIHARDFFPDDRGEQSAALMARCRGALDGFAQAVYIAEGVQEIADDSIQPASTENGRAGSGGANASSATSPR